MLMVNRGVWEGLGHFNGHQMVLEGLRRVFDLEILMVNGLSWIGILTFNGLENSNGQQRGLGNINGI